MVRSSLWPLFDSTARTNATRKAVAYIWCAVINEQAPRARPGSQSQAEQTDKKRNVRCRSRLRRTAWPLRLSNDVRVLRACPGRESNPDYGYLPKQGKDQHENARQFNIFPSSPQSCSCPRLHRFSSICGQSCQEFAKNLFDVSARNRENGAFSLCSPSIRQVEVRCRSPF